MTLPYSHHGSSDWTSATNQRHSSIKTDAWTEDEDENRNKEKKPFFWSPCIKGCIIGMLLGGIVLAIFITLLLTSRSTKTNQTSILSTSTSSPSLTSPTSTAFISTSSTSLTFTTSTSSASTSSTSSTSTTSSSSASTSSTSTSSTTTPHPCGIPTSIGSASSIYSATSGSSSYTCKYFEWISPTNGSVTLAFQLRIDPDKWYMDDVSVSTGITEMLLNGDFESGSFSPGWTASTPNGDCGYLPATAQVGTSSCRTGTYCLIDGCSNRFDQISQSFVAILGQSYFVSFWLKTSGGSGTLSVSVTLS